MSHLTATMAACGLLFATPALAQGADDHSGVGQPKATTAAAPAYQASGGGSGGSATSGDFIGSGSGALLFTMGGIFGSTPASFDGVGIGGLYFFDRDLALRAGLGLSISSNDVETKGGGGATVQSDNSASNYALEGGVHYLLKRAGSVHLYTGGILQVSTGSEDPDGNDNDVSRFGFAIAGLLGGNWFFADHTSLGAEYRLGYASGSETRETGGGGERKTSTSNFGVGAASILLGFWFQ